MSEDKNDKNYSNEANSSSRPTTPTNDDCCGNSCVPCVFDVHKRLLDQWENRKVRGIKRIRENNYLNPLAYKIFFVKDLAQAGEEFIKIQLDCSTSICQADRILHALEERIDQDSRIFLNPGQHVILSMSDKKSRPYTPINWTSDSFELLIKIYPNGEFTSNLKRIKIADEIRARGPYGDFAYKRNSFKEIVAFSIGSGIAAIYPIARSIVNDEIDETRIHLVAGFRTIAQNPLTRELRQLSDYWNVNCTLQISCLGGDEIFPSGTEIQQGRLNEATLRKILENHEPEKTLILICGTREFNETLKNWINHRDFFNYHVFS